MVSRHIFVFLLNGKRHKEINKMANNLKQIFAILDIEKTIEHC